VTPEAGQGAGGYTLVLPPGWRRIPLRQGTSAALRKILDDAFSGLPRDKVAPYRIEVERRMKEQIADARRNAGIDMYIPVERAASGPVPASFVVSDAFLGPADSAETVDPAQVVAYLASAGGEGGEGGRTRIAHLDGASGVRVEATVPGDPGAELPYGSRRCQYIVPVPGHAGRWLLVTFSTPGARDPDGEFAILLTELFDAIMSTFRWTPVPERARG
jgi:hypothetical protein